MFSALDKRYRERSGGGGGEEEGGENQQSLRYPVELLQEVMAAAGM